MSGSGYKSWATGDVVTAAELNGYLMKQAILYFADTTARDAAVTSPEEGMHAYLADTNKVTAYDGTAWREVGGYILTTKGDLLVQTGTGLTRLPAGTDTHLLTADSAQAAGVKWAAAPAGNHIEGKETAGGSATESVTWTSAFGSTPVVTTAAIDATASVLSAVMVVSRSTTGASLHGRTYNGSSLATYTGVKMATAREAT